MIEKFNGGLIDDTSVMLIINKLTLYIENEEKIVNNIVNSLFMLDNYYSGENNKVLDVKKQNTYDTLNTMLKNRKEYVEFLKSIVDSYIENDDRNQIEFQNGIN